MQLLLAKKGRDDDATWSSITINKGSVQHLDFLTQQEKDVYKTAFELDQRWVIEHAADRTPFVCQSQSVNIFLPADVHKRDLHQIHMLAWKRGMKSLYYCRSLSIQRADNVSEKNRTPHHDGHSRSHCPDIGVGHHDELRGMSSLSVEAMTPEPDQAACARP